MSDTLLVLDIHLYWSENKLLSGANGIRGRNCAEQSSRVRTTRLNTDMKQYTTTSLEVGSLPFLPTV